MTALYDQYLDAFKRQSPSYYPLYQQLLKQYTDYALQQGASPAEAQAYASRLGYVNFQDYGNGDPAAGWQAWRTQQANNLKNIDAERAAGVGFSPGGVQPGDPTGRYPTGAAPPPTGGGTPTPGGSGGVPPLPAGLPPSQYGYLYQNGQWLPAPGPNGEPGVWGTPTPGAAPPPTAGGAPPPPTGGGGGGGPPGAPGAPPPGGGGPAAAYGAITSLLPGYGLSQNLKNFGIPGFETSPLVAGGSWGGTTFEGAPYTNLQYVPIPNSDTTNPQSPYYRGPVTNPDGTPISPGIDIKPAIPYQTSVFQQTYSDKPPPYPYIHAQIGEAMKGIQTAYPGFAWAGPQTMARAQAGATGMPPGGWTQMLGYTPGAPTNYGFQGGRPNPYGFANIPLTINPAAGG